MFRARPGLKAAAWARLQRAWASEDSSPSPSPRPRLEAPGPGFLGLQIFWFQNMSWGTSRKQLLNRIKPPGFKAQARGLAILKPKPQIRSSPASGPARLGQARARLGRAQGLKPGPEHHYAAEQAAG
ncbi:hypothetical protein DFH06DRAFT_1123734 [Mycena polygramma]|nr:hypothetical protein DFH06DRAFT_1123734 [Mycena polygramma]